MNSENCFQISLAVRKMKKVINPGGGTLAFTFKKVSPHHWGSYKLPADPICQQIELRTYNVNYLHENYNNNDQD